MRVASGVIGGLGALLGALKGLSFVVFWLVLGPLQTASFVPFDFLAVGADGAVAIFCVLGAAGAGLTIGGRPRPGALLMLVGAAGTTVAAVAYGLLLPLTQPPVVRHLYADFPTDVGFYVQWLFPVPPLLVGAALAFILARRQTEG